MSLSASMEGSNHLHRKRKARSRKIRQEEKSKEAKSPYEFSFAIMRIVVSQICQSVGFRVTQLSALETLTDIATKHLQAVARSAFAFSNFSNRTESNIFDVVNGLHDLCSVRGFFDASSLHISNYSLLSSITLVDLANFSEITVEVPFAKPIPQNKSSESSLPPSAFSQRVRHYPPDSHIPNWLPPFPDVSTYKPCKSQEKRKNGEELWENLIPWENSDAIVIRDHQESNANREISVHEEEKYLELKGKRGRVRFGIGGTKRRGI